MALHRVIEKHKVNILGQEITYTNKFLKHTKGTSYGFKPSSSLISYSSGLFKYEYVHPILPPTLLKLPGSGKTYIVPTWQEVHPETTLQDIEWIKPAKVEIPVEKNTWKFESSSDPGHFYMVRKVGETYKCSCPGVWRSKNRKCKHILKVENDNK